MSMFSEPDFYPHLEYYNLEELYTLQKDLIDNIQRCKRNNMSKLIESTYAIHCMDSDIKEFFNDDINPIDLLNKILKKIVGKELPTEYIEEFYTEELPCYMRITKDIK